MWSGQQLSSLAPIPEGAQEDEFGDELDQRDLSFSPGGALATYERAFTEHGALPAADVPRGERAFRRNRNKGARGPSVWLRIDTLGNASAITGDKFKLAMKLGVQPRDLRLLDPQMASVSPPAILDRDHAIVVNLGSIKCIITLECVMVINPEDPVGAALVAELHTKLSNPMHVGKVMAYPGLSKLSELTRRSGPGVSLGLSFELKVLEISLDMVVSALGTQAHDIESVVLPALDKLTRAIRPGDLELVRRMKNRLTRLVKRTEATKQVLERFLSDDQDMHRLNLTAQEQSRQVVMPGNLQELLARNLSLTRHSPGGSRAHSRTGSKHGSRHGSSHGSSSSSSSSSGGSSSLDLQDEAEVAEVEMLLEAYQMQLDTTFNRLQTLETFIQDTEDLVNLSLDTHRNRMIRASIVLTSLFTMLGLCTTMSGIFAVSVQFPFDPQLSTDPQPTFTVVALAAASLGPAAVFGVFWLWMWRSRLLM